MGGRGRLDMGLAVQHALTEREVKVQHELFSPSLSLLNWIKVWKVMLDRTVVGLNEVSR